ncbi:hypothetical protein GW17_00057972 [Ensete ventricosum]|nr:hypothetical protein GW17_00057972 [Ensete ventricosum]
MSRTKTKQKPKPSRVSTPDLSGLDFWGCSSPPSPPSLGLRFRLKGESFFFLWSGVALPTMALEGEESVPIGAVSGGRSAKGRRLWKKVKYQLVEYHSLPGYLKDNEYILGYYRSEWPLKQILLSIFTVHNETLNVWT